MILFPLSLIFNHSIIYNPIIVPEKKAVNYAFLAIFLSK